MKTQQLIPSALSKSRSANASWRSEQTVANVLLFGLLTGAYVY